MLDTIEFLESVPASAIRTIQIPLVNPSEWNEIQVSSKYAGGSGSAGTATITITGTGGAGQDINGEIGGNAFAYVGGSGDTTNTLSATHLTTFLAAKSDIAGLCAVTSAAGVVTLTALEDGAGSADITLSAVGTGTAVATPSGANFSAGTDPGVSGTSGIETSFMISRDKGVTWVDTNASGFTVEGDVAIQSESLIYSQNDPLRIDGATVTDIQVTVENLDATYPAIVTVLGERKL